MARARELEGVYGLIHADLAPANWVFHNGQPRPIDFDEFGRGFYLYDLLGVLWSHVSRDAYPAFKAHLLSGYERIRPLATEIKASADLFQAATLFAWLNHGCRLTDDAARAEFLKWIPSTTRTIARLCRI
jgi:Ser/Thr protein kinase RdoA (MazF antagonist)